MIEHETVNHFESFLEGHVSLERRNNAMKPWRVPFEKRSLFPPHALNGKAEIPAGVRFRFKTNTQFISLGIKLSEPGGRFDCLVNGARTHSVPVETAEETTIHFDNLPPGEKIVELYLPQNRPVTIYNLAIGKGASIEPVDTKRLRWTTYGSSITQCSEADGPSETWPAIVARSLDFDLTCLGFGGNCHLEPMVARLIRDLPADVITLCLGINVYGSSSLNPRTFQAAVIGFIETIREKHTHTPLAVISPIASPPRETKTNSVGFTLEMMREEIRDAVQKLQAFGDSHLLYVDGLTIFDLDAAKTKMPDQLHPNADGYRLMAKRMQEHLFSHSLFARLNPSA